MRAFLVYPTYIVFPNLLPTVQLFDALHRGKRIFMQKKRVKFFWSVFIGIFVWEWFPEFIAPSVHHLLWCFFFHTDIVLVLSPVSASSALPTAGVPGSLASLVAPPVTKVLEHLLCALTGTTSVPAEAVWELWYASPLSNLLPSLTRALFSSHLFRPNCRCTSVLLSA